MHIININIPKLNNSKNKKISVFYKNIINNFKNSNILFNKFDNNYFNKNYK